MRLALNPPARDAPLEPGIMEGSPPPANGTVLSLPAERSEVVAALSSLRNYKAAGSGGCPTELFKYALLPDDDLAFPLTPAADVAQHLADSLNACFMGGEVPAIWNVVLVSPVFKRGDRANTSNYRPISVGGYFSKLYAIVLDRRLVAWLEVKGLRAVCQTSHAEHAIFALRHLI